jgi:uncharacterized protein Yka (UPF0111/DUF47 family)
MSIEEDITMTNMNEIDFDNLDKVAGGVMLYDDLSPEEIKETARRYIQEWKDQGRSLEDALELLTRYFCVPGKVERDEIAVIVREVFGVA